ncbi:hypothetical protein Taro_054787, partial [Colocasia esculenta]|nr:hypothetical protein [Colocasia esculenta]
MPDVELDEDSGWDVRPAPLGPFGPVLRVAPGALAATWSRKSGLPRQHWVAPHPAAAFFSRRGLPSRPCCGV